MAVYFQQSYRNLGELSWVYLHLNNISARPLPSKHFNIPKKVDGFTEASSINTVLYI